VEAGVDDDDESLPQATRPAGKASAPVRISRRAMRRGMAATPGQVEIRAMVRTSWRLT
jgi:hypothetical protein